LKYKDQQESKKKKPEAQSRVGEGYRFIEKHLERIQLQKSQNEPGNRPLYEQRLPFIYRFLMVDVGRCI